MPQNRSSSAASSDETGDIEGRLSTGGLVSEEGGAPEDGQALEVTGRTGSLLYGSEIPRFNSDAALLARGSTGIDPKAGISASFHRLGSGVAQGSQVPIDVALSAAAAGDKAGSGVSVHNGAAASDAELQLFDGQKLAASSLISVETPETTPQHLAPRGLAAGQAPVGDENLLEPAATGRGTASSDSSKSVTAEKAAQDGLEALRRAVNGAEDSPVSKRTLTSQEALGKGEAPQLGTDTVRGKLQALQGGENPISRAEFLETVTAASARAVDSVASSSSSNAASAPTSVAAAGLAAPAANSPLANGVSAATNTDLALYHSPAEHEFADEFAAHVRTMVKEGAQEARLQLHPAELGRLHVTIATDGDQARVQFLAESPAAREMIEQNLPRLREMLQEQGLQLAESDVGTRGESEFADQSGDRPGSTEESLSETDLVTGSMLASLAADSPTSRIDIHV
ncbi:MAG: flagellar hook-length control protein FliK [Pseudomonadota bacterium]